MTNWAVVVGINQYEHLSPKEHLEFAVSDAERVKQFLCKTAGFQEDFVILCSDTSKPVSGLNTRPDSVSLRKILRKLSEHPNAQNAEQAWFFFSGHGLLGKDNQNYLLTRNSDPEDLEHSAISVEFVIQQLIRCNARNMVLVLDMCRNEVPSDSKGSSGFNEAQIVQQAQQNGIITIFSCSRGGKSYEIPDLQQGAFTHAFLAGLQQHTILRQLDSYLRDRVYALTQAKQPAQIPLIVPEPGWKYDHPLLPHCVTKNDIEALKAQAIHAWIIEKDLDLAQKKWELVNDFAANPQDRKLSRESLVKIAQEQKGLSKTPSEPTNPVDSPLPAPISQPLLPPIKQAIMTQQPELSQKCDSIFQKAAINNIAQVGQQIKQAMQQETFQKAAINNIAQVGQQIKQAMQQETMPPEDDLSLEKGIDYTKLRDLLKNQKWDEASNETFEILNIEILDLKGEWFSPNDTLAFPCIDLLTIDELWQEHSHGRFGFSVQKKIFYDCGGNLSKTFLQNKAAIEKWGNWVGWRTNQSWNDSRTGYERVLDENAIPLGHHPYFAFDDSVECYKWIASLCFKLESCFSANFANSNKLDSLSLLFEDDLSSEKGIDYTKLRDLLKAQKWKEADQETADRTLEAIKKETWWEVELEDLLTFPCADLKTIDALWVKYSKGHFGFSVQKQIYVECGGKLDGIYPGDEIWEKFGDRVGWRQDGNWLGYSDLNPSLSSFQGIFPIFEFFGWRERDVVWGFGLFLSRRDL